ncbi:hypothetical protein LEN26_001085 [Aphanomyces euteiches]|nr:hypothetical protein AeMF1_000894 [Aphanomyces euteiches]KAH9162122.1 hypothetical protein LEN26_001085 [Aphanomyces euteiches]
MIVPALTAAIPEPYQGELMAIHSINQKLLSLDWKLVEKELEEGMVYLGDASLSDWEAFVTTKDQQLKSKNMEWIDGKIFIVELPSQEHATYVGRLVVAILDAAHTQEDFVKNSLDAYIQPVSAASSQICVFYPVESLHSLHTTFSCLLVEDQPVGNGRHCGLHHLH